MSFYLLETRSTQYLLTHEGNLPLKLLHNNHPCPYVGLSLCQSSKSPKLLMSFPIHCLLLGDHKGIEITHPIFKSITTLGLSCIDSKGKGCWGIFSKIIYLRVYGILHYVRRR